LIPAYTLADLAGAIWLAAVVLFAARVLS